MAQVELFDIARNIRGIHEHLLDISMKTGATAGSCLYASVLLASAVNRFTGMRAIVRGGASEDGCGYIDSAGAAHGHYWVEAGDGATAWVVDITGDQFGEAVVVVAALPPASVRYRPGAQEVIDQHTAEALAPEG